MINEWDRPEIEAKLRVDFERNAAGELVALEVPITREMIAAGRNANHVSAYLHDDALVDIYRAMHAASDTSLCYILAKMLNEVRAERDAALANGSTA